MMPGYGEWNVNDMGRSPVMPINMVTLIFIAAVAIAVALLALA